MTADDVLTDGLELGYVRLWRKIKGSAVFQDPHLLQLWIWILLRAAWESRTVMVKTGRGNTPVNLNPGEFIFGRNTAATALRCPASTIADRMRTLKNLKMVSIQAVTHYSVVTVLNWDSYQGGDIPSRHPIRQASRHPTVTQPSQRSIKELEEGNTSLSAPAEGPPSDRGNGKDAGGAQDLFDLWNSEATSLPKATKLTEGRKRKIQARLRERPIDAWGEIFRQMGRSSFLRGESGNGSFRADLDWIIANEENALKVIEGRYDDREKGGISSGRGTQSRDGECAAPGVRQKYAGR